MTASAEIDAAFAGEIGLSGSAFTAGTEAAAQFLGAAAAFGLMQSGVSAGAAFSTAGQVEAVLSAGASAEDVFAVLAGKKGELTAGTSAGDVFDVFAQNVGQLIGLVDVESAFDGMAASLAIITAGVVLGATFTATSSGDPEPPMRRIVRSVQEIRAVRVPSRQRVVRVH